jgi:uncharacterized membrane protein
MTRALAAYAFTALAFFPLDALWLTLAADPIYRANLGEILLPGFRLIPAALFYFIYMGGVTYFAVLPAVAAQSRTKALINGAALGFVCYATYDLTNQATLKTWSTTVTVVDLVWGSLATALAALASTSLMLRKAS